MAKGYKVANLGIEITSSAQGAVKALNSLTDAIKRANTASNSLHDKFVKLGTVSTALNGVNTSINKIGSGMSKAAGDTDKYTKQMRNSVQALSGTISSMGRTLMYTIGFGSFQQGLNTLARIGSGSFLAASDFVENYNLFNVSFAADTEEAIKFQEKFNYILGSNISETMRYQGFFNNLAGSLGITNDASALLSENLTKLTYDLSSLFNMPIDLMYSKLQSGIIGQTKPLRSVGIDVTQQTLQPILYEMGIDKLVTELTQAEKVLLRYISILRQSGNAQGDFARTIETPANQLRVLRNQIEELSRWFGTTFMGVVGSILPYLNAVVMVLKEIFKWFSIIMGFNLEDYNFIGEQDQLLYDISDGFDEATGSAEKFKKSLYGFDELNLADSSQAATGYSPLNTLGLSPTYFKLQQEMEKFKYDLAEVKMRATEIAEKILTWIGFTQDANGAINGTNENLDRTKAIIAGIIGLFVGKAIFGFIVGAVSGFGELHLLMETIAKSPLFISIGKSLGTLFSGIGVTAVAISALIVAFGIALVEVWKKSEVFRDRVKTAIDATKRVFEGFYEKVKPYLDNLGDTFDSLWKDSIVPLWEGFVEATEGIASVFLELWIIMAPVFETLASAFGELLGVVISIFGNAIVKNIRTAVDVIAWLLRMIGDLLKWIADGIKALRYAWEGDWSYMTSFLSNTVAWLDGAFKNIWKNVWNSVASIFTNAFNGIKSFFDGIINGIIGGINNAISKVNSVSLIKIPTIEITDNRVDAPKVVGGTGGTATTPNNSVGRPIIEMYANGGMPNSGQMFMARENGIPEMVGSIGTRTAVANNAQIVEAVSSGVARAVSSVMGSGGNQVNIYLDDVLMGNALIDSINRSGKLTGKTVTAI